jgi:hypothetical protein
VLLSMEKTKWDRCIRSKETILREMATKIEYVKPELIFWPSPGTFW